MKSQKTYVFPKAGGGEVKLTLARPTNERTIRFLNALGKKSFSELVSSEGQMQYAIFILDLAVNADTLKEMLDICLEEGNSEVQIAGMDQRIADEVIQDFFDQRGRMFQQRLLNSQV